MIILCLEMDWHRIYGMKEVNGEWYIYKSEPEDYQKSTKVIDNYAALFQEPTMEQGWQLHQ